jgi:hypothetical protein
VRHASATDDTSVEWPPNSSSSRRCASAPAKRLVRVLAMQVEQCLAECGELGERGRPPVDPRTAASLRVLHAAQQKLGARIEFGFCEPALRVARRCDVE